MGNESKDSQGNIQHIHIYRGKKQTNKKQNTTTNNKKNLHTAGEKKPQNATWDANFIPAEKLTTGKKRPSMLKFSNIPWTGWPFIRKEMLGALRSKQQLITSSVLKRCWLGEFTVRATQPIQVKETHLAKPLKNIQQPKKTEWKQR